MTDPQLDAAEKAFRAAYLDPGLMRHALRKAVEAADEAAWQPMETAPKDGVYVMVYAAPREGLRGFVTHAAFHSDAGWCVDELRHTTHWRPLPAPPESAP